MCVCVCVRYAECGAIERGSYGEEVVECVVKRNTRRK